MLRDQLYNATVCVFTCMYNKQWISMHSKLLFKTLSNHKEKQDQKKKTLYKNGTRTGREYHKTGIINHTNN